VGGMSVPKVAAHVKGPSLREMLCRDLHEQILPKHLKLVPQLNEVYELELAYYHRFSYRFYPPNIEGAVRDLLSFALA